MFTMQCRCTVSRLDRVRNETAEVEPLRPSQRGKAALRPSQRGKAEMVLDMCRGGGSGYIVE